MAWSPLRCFYAGIRTPANKFREALQEFWTKKSVREWITNEEPEAADFFVLGHSIAMNTPDCDTAEQHALKIMETLVAVASGKLALVISKKVPASVRGRVGELMHERQILAAKEIVPLIFTVI
jgi:hypothetical protein